MPGGSTHFPFIIFKCQQKIAKWFPDCRLPCVSPFNKTFRGKKRSMTMLYLATITLAFSFVAQCFSLPADRMTRKSNKRSRSQNKSDKMNNSLAEKLFQRKNKRPECPQYEACPNFINGMQHRDKRETPSSLKDRRKDTNKVCAEGTSENVELARSFLTV